jgi:hypothetical protein
MKSPGGDMVVIVLVMAKIMKSLNMVEERMNPRSASASQGPCQTIYKSLEFSAIHASGIILLG